MNGIRLGRRDRVYDLFFRLAIAASKRRGIIRLAPPGCAKPRPIGVDATAYPGFGKRLQGAHSLDGSRVTLWYRACRPADATQVAKAAYATRVLRIPRQRYTGTLVDIFRHKGNLYALLAGVLERDRENNRHMVNFRHFNLEDGDLYRAFIEEPDQSAIKAVGKAMQKQGGKSCSTKP